MPTRATPPLPHPQPAPCDPTGSPAGRAAPTALHVLLAAPRGFCAGVSRAIGIVEAALRHYGPPVYVRHEIVHNPHVVAELAAAGAVFVDDLAAVPTGRPVIFSAHGVARAVVETAAGRKLEVLDATCPLVSKVHHEARRHHAQGGAQGRHLLVIGHAGHPEIEGTLGQIPPGAATLVQNIEAARTVSPPDPTRLAYVTQTTLSVDDSAAIIAVLRARFPEIVGPRREDICYATTNRQEAVKAIAARADLVIVLGAAHSSNAQRLREVAAATRTPALLLADAATLRLELLDGVRVLGLSAGASVPESQIQALLGRLASRFRLSVEEVVTATETTRFRLPAALVV